MNVLLLGANGQLGSDILRMNEKNKFPINIIGLTRKELDITNKDDLTKVLHQHTFDVLLNCTSYHNTEQVEANAGIAFDINAFAVKQMSLLCKEKNARFFHISTDYIFSHSENPINENAIPSPLNIYGASKLMGESLATTTHRDVVVFRVASLFGAKGASGKGGNFVETIIKNAKNKKPLRVIADQIMSPTYTLDLAHIILKAIELSLPNGLYHTVNSGIASWHDFAKTILELTHINTNLEPISTKEYPSIVLRPSYSALDNSKIKKYVGDIPNWQDALKRYLIEKGHIN